MAVEKACGRFFQNFLTAPNTACKSHATADTHGLLTSKGLAPVADSSKEPSPQAQVISGRGFVAKKSCGQCEKKTSE